MSLTKQEFRSAMSLYPTGVAVVTTDPEGHAAFGLTVNSFTSLSLEPALIMWNLQKSSDTYKAWHDVESFAVNFLREEQRDLSAHYARRGDHDLDMDQIVRGSTGCPILADCMANLECKMHARYEEGDHVIIIGEVVAVMAQEDSNPLVFHRSAYTSLS